VGMERCGVARFHLKYAHGEVRRAVLLAYYPADGHAGHTFDLFGCNIGIVLNLHGDSPLMI
jgi:hypothetical protein